MAGIKRRQKRRTGRKQHRQTRRINRHERRAESHSEPPRRKLALALQGGGSHGAFTWGVLDRLLDGETIEIIGVTGTSAGAMNGAVLVDGLVRGGPQEASAELRNMMAQGYIRISDAGQNVLLIQNPRAVRGGLSFIF